MEHPKFLSSAVYTSFIDENPQLFDLKPSQNRAQKLLNYIGDVLVNGPSTPLVTDIPPAEITVATPETPAGNECVLHKVHLVYQVRNTHCLVFDSFSPCRLQGCTR